MAKVTYTLLDRDYDSIPENENYSQSDINLIENYQVNKSFRADRHYIETHFYSLNNSKIFSLYNYDISTDVDIDAEGNVTNLNLKPEQLSIDNGFTGVDHKIVYHFLNDLYSQTDSKQPLFINTISQDRKEVLLYTDDIDVNTLITKTEQLKANINSKSYFEEYWLNLGDNDLYIVTNVDVYELEDKFTVALKLYEPLPKTFDIKHQVQLVEKVSDSIVVEVQVEVEDEPDITPKLRGANFDIELDTNNPTPTEYLNYDELFSYSNANSNREIYSYIKDKSVNINIDYSDYENFIHFSSAQERLKNFKYKVELLQTYDSSKNAIINSANSSGSISHFDRLINGVVENFDHYEKDMYFNSGSNCWPKLNSAKPYINSHSTSSASITWYASQLTSASNYDTSNYDVLTNTLPSYIAEDSNNSNASLFVNMVGQHFDNLWVYTKAITDKYDNDNRVDVGISKDLVREVLSSFGTKLYNSKEGANDLFKYLVADTYDSGSSEEVINTFTQVPNIPSDSQPLARKEYEGELYKRIYHNLPYLVKTKGTERGLRALINCFGIPSEFLSINEYGGNVIGSQKFFGTEGSLTPDSVNSNDVKVDKVRTETRASGSAGKVLTKSKSIQKSETTRTPDIHRLEVGFSPATSINKFIIDQLPTSFNIDDLIGDPREQNKNQYFDLMKEAHRVLHSSTQRTELNDFIRILKFYDNVLFKMIKDFVPATATLDTGIIIKPHVLNRSKIKSPELSGTRPEYSASIDMLTTSGSAGGAYETAPILTPYTRVLEHQWTKGLGGRSNFVFKPDFSNINSPNPGEIVVHGTEFYHPDGNLYNFDDRAFAVYTPYEGSVSNDMSFYLMFSSESIQNRFNMAGAGWSISSFTNKHPHLIPIDYSPHGQDSWVARDNNPNISASFAPLDNDVIIAAFTLEAETDRLTSFTNFTKPLITLPNGPKTTIHKESIKTLSGSVDRWIEDESPKLNGELGGTTIEVTDGELNVLNEFKQVNVPALNYDVIKIDQGSSVTYTSFNIDKDAPSTTSTASCGISPNINDILYHSDTGSYPATIGTYVFTDIAGTNTFAGDTGDKWYRLGNATTIRISGSAGGNAGYVGEIVPCSDFDNTAPSGYRAVWNQKYINSTNYTSASFAIFGGNMGETYQVTASLESDPTEVAYDTGTIYHSTMSVHLDTTDITDGANVLLNVKLVDQAGNVGLQAAAHNPTSGASINSLTASLKDIIVPSGYNVDFKAYLNGNQSATSYSNGNFYVRIGNIATGEQGQATISITSSGPGMTAYTQTLSFNNSDGNSPTFDFNVPTSAHSLPSGTLTVTAYLSDTAGNIGLSVTDSVPYTNTAGILDHANYFNSMTINRFSQTVYLRVRSLTPTNLSWTISDNATHITPSQTSGTGADSSVPISVSANSNSSGRWGTVNLLAGNNTIDTFSIYQQGTNTGTGSGCIAPFVKILMSDGSEKLAGIVNVGDEIKTQQENNLKWINARISEKKVINSDRIKVYIGDQEIVVSPKHRFYVDNKSQYVDADLLEEGDILSGKEYKTTEDYNPGDVIKLTVEHAKTYISNGVLSHNTKGIL